MIATLLLALTLALPQQTPDPWWAEDKFRHFAASFVVTSLSASAARAAGADRPQSLYVGAGVAATSGIAKEIDDRRRGGIFSLRDLVWDAVGIAAALLVLDASR